MAKLTVYTNFTLKMDTLDFGFVTTGSFHTRETSLYEGIIHSFTGRDLSYGGDNLPNAGTFTGYAVQHYGNEEWDLNDAEVSAVALVAAAKTSDTEDDQAILAAFLSGDDSVAGANMSDVLLGFGGNDALLGRLGNDKLYGGAGDDTLMGGEGGDKLYGGEGADTFAFKTYDSRKSAQSRDTIYDFSRGEDDVIDLHFIDAVAKKSGNQAFKFIGKQDFHDKAGELRYEKKGGDTYVYGDTNGDGKIDLAIKLDDSLSLVKGDFIL